MALLKYIITEGKKDVMINKIGLPEPVADDIIKKIPKKYQMWSANLLINTALSAIFNKRIESQSDVQQLKARYESGENTYGVNNIINNFDIEEIREFIDSYLKNPILPIINLRDMPTYDHMIDIKRKLTSIRDYAERTNQNFQNDNFEEVYQESLQWHEEIEQGASRKELQLKEGQVVITEFDDGYYWVDLKTNECEDEGDSMGHCGYTGADTLLSLRDPKGVPHVTVAYDYNGEALQIKGKGNTKPVEKYHPYIVDLIIKPHNPDPKAGKPTYTYQITSMGAEHNPKDDFHVIDLARDQFDDLLEDDKSNLVPWFKENFILSLSSDDLSDVIDIILSRHVMLFADIMKFNDWSLPDQFRTGVKNNLFWELTINNDKEEFEIRTNSLDLFLNDFVSENDWESKSKDQLLREYFRTRLNLVYKEGDDYIIPIDNEFGVEWVFGYHGIIDQLPFE